MRNFEGVITTYPEPESYIPGSADEYFKTIYTDNDDLKSEAGIAGLFQDTQFNIIPKNLERYNKRKQYSENPNHSTIKDNRDRRDTIREKKFNTQLKSKGDGTKKEGS